MWHAHARHARCSTCTHCCSHLAPSRQRAWEIPHPHEWRPRRATCSPGNQARRPQRLAHGLARFLFSLARNGTRVHHNEIGCFNGHFSPTVRNKGGCEIVTFDTVHLATKVHHMESGCIIFSLFQQRHSLHSAIDGNQTALNRFRQPVYPKRKRKSRNNKKAPSSMPGAFMLAS